MLSGFFSPHVILFIIWMMSFANFFFRLTCNTLHYPQLKFFLKIRYINTSVLQVKLSLVNLVISSHWMSKSGSTDPCFNFSSFCIALTSFKKRSIDGAGDGKKMSATSSSSLSVNYLLLSRVIDVKWLLYLSPFSQVERLPLPPLEYTKFHF